MSHKKHQARLHAVQAVYQWQMTGQDIREICSQFLSDQVTPRVDTSYFSTLLVGVQENLGELDSQLKECLDRSIESVDPVERAILRLGAYELILQPTVPYRVVINEAVELAKVFGAEQGHRYVNGVLDKLSRKIRNTQTAD
ncbi:MAG: transcription antitermination factor NusB [Gammaproteobacteria bacterium]|nr:transcription antitermination factor NusB [Gammaproteobacteria bacterium]